MKKTIYELLNMGLALVTCILTIAINLSMFYIAHLANNAMIYGLNHGDYEIYGLGSDFLGVVVIDIIVLNVAYIWIYTAVTNPTTKLQKKFYSLYKAM